MNLHKAGTSYLSISFLDMVFKPAMRKTLYTPRQYYPKKKESTDNKIKNRHFFIVIVLVYKITTIKYIFYYKESIPQKNMD